MCIFPKWCYIFVMIIMVQQFSHLFTWIYDIFTMIIYFLCVCVFDIHSIANSSISPGYLVPFFISIFVYFFPSYSLERLYFFLFVLIYTVSIPTMITKLEMKTNKLKFICIWFVLCIRIVVAISVASSQYVANVSTEMARLEITNRNFLFAYFERSSEVRWYPSKWNERARTLTHPHRGNTALRSTAQSNESKKTRQ